MASGTWDLAHEAARALTDGVLLPFRVAGHVIDHPRLLAEATADLSARAPVDPAPSLDSLPDRPLEVFVSCAEASGEEHAIRLVDELREALDAEGAPPPVIRGLGGPRLAARDVELLDDPVSNAAMGLDVVRSLPRYVRMIGSVAKHLHERRPDVFCGVDSPALHVPLAHVAQRAKVPAVHYVTPQYWAWAPWRVTAYRGVMDLALTALPFERAWFDRHDVPTAHVGHPELDALERITPGLGAGRDLVLLPGSRESVVRRNLPWMVRVLRRVRELIGEVPVVLSQEREEIARTCAELLGRDAEWIRIEGGGLHAALAQARAAFSVSGTILVDVLHHRVPAVVIYRLARGWQVAAVPHTLTVPYFSSINLLAAEEVVPEFYFHGDGPLEDVAQSIARAYADDAWRAGCRRGLDRAAERLGPSGASRRAALHLLSARRGA